MRTRWAACALIGVVAFFVAGVAGVAGALDGDKPSNTGWWSQDPSASEQPAGGFQISAVAGQPVSVAAVRFSAPSGVLSASLSLQEAEGFVSPASTVDVCRTTEPWEPANPGAYDDAPTPDCASKVTLDRDAEALVWSAEVAGLLPSLGGETSLMIVPGETAGGGSPLDPGFRVTFSEAALKVVAAPGTTTAPSTTAYVAPPSSGGSSGFTGSGSSFTPPAAPAPLTTPDTSPADAAPSTGAAFQPPTLSAGASPGGDGADGVDQPWERLLFLIPIATAIGVASVYTRRWLEQRGVVEA